MSKVKINRNTPVPLSARRKLELSQLRLDQLELMGKDFDVAKFKLLLKSAVQVDISEAILDATVTRTIAGASSLNVDVLDKERKLLRSGKIAHGLDVQIDGLWFRLVNPKKQGDKITLVFEDREVAVLRSYAKPIKASGATDRARVTRAEFIRRLIMEPKEFKIPYVIPELTKVQPIGTPTEGAMNAAPDIGTSRNLGLAKGAALTVKNSPAKQVQLDNAEIILETAVPRPRAVMVMAIMCAIQESGIMNLGQPSPGASNWLSVDPDKNPVGVFQQIKADGWPASRNIATDATAFLDRVNDEYKKSPSAPYWQLIENVQNSGNGPAYAKWRTEAERFVTAFGVSPSTQAEANNQWLTNTSSKDYQFYRGIPPVTGQNGWLPENSWNCIQRLASEVNWYAFFVSGTFYYVSGEDLFSSKPRMRITEGVEGVDSIDFDYDENKKVGTCTVNCRIGRWDAPPGAVVELYDMGPSDGRWLITDVERSLFNDAGTISLEKPNPKLPEPVSDSFNSKSSTLVGPYGSKVVNSRERPGTDPSGSAMQLATELLRHYGRTWRDDNGLGKAQIEQVALGMPLYHPSRGQVYMSPGPIRAVLWLISKGYTIGTYAWCTDHSDDGPDGHAGGKAVDISSINTKAINIDTNEVYQLTLAVATDLHDATGDLAPRQLITGGYGGHRDMTLSALSIPAADSFYGSETMGQHCNHIHYGV